MENIAWVGLLLNLIIAFFVVTLLLPPVLLGVSYYASASSNWALAERLCRLTILLLRLVSWLPFAHVPETIARAQLDLSYYWKRMGRKDEESIKILRQADAVLKRQKGGFDLSRGRVLINLAGALGRSNREEEALEVEREALQIFEKNKAAYLSATILTSHSASLSRLGRLREGRAAAEQAVDLLRSAQSPEAERGLKESLCLALNNLALTYLHAQDWSRAIEIFRQSLILKEAIFSERDPSLIMALNNLGCSYVKGGWLDEAKSSLTRAWQLADGNTAAADRTRCAIKINLAYLHRRCGNLQKADEELSLARDLRDDGDEMLKSALSAETGRILAEQGRLRESRHCFEEAIDSWERKGTADHPKLVPTLVDYAQVLEMSDEADQAAVNRERAEGIVRLHELSSDNFFPSPHLQLTLKTFNEQ